MTVHPTAGTTRSTRSPGWVPFALVALVLVPALFGSLRLIGLAGGPQLMPADPQMIASPVPVIVHIVSAVGYAVGAAIPFGDALHVGLRSASPDRALQAEALLITAALVLLPSLRRPSVAVIAVALCLPLAVGVAHVFGFFGISV